MQFLKNIQKMVQAQESLEDTLYASVLEEVNSGMVMKELWAKSMAHGDFDPDRTRAFYIRERVARLKKKSKAISEYLRLVAQEAELDSVKSLEMSRYEEKVAVHKQKLQKLEAERQKLANQITVEASELNQRKSEAVAAIRAEAAESAAKRANEKKQLLFVGAGAVALTCFMVVFDVQLMASVAVGFMGMIAIVAGLANGDDNDFRIEKAKKTLEAEAPLQDLREQCQQVTDRIQEVKGQAPEIKLATTRVDSARKGELERELQYLFNLEPLDEASVRI